MFTQADKDRIMKQKFVNEYAKFIRLENMDKPEFQKFLRDMNAY